MSFISFVDHATASPEARREWDRLVAQQGRVTHMKQTLLHSVPTFRIYQEWYTLHDLLLPVIGERGVALFSYAISHGARCLVCSLFFRKQLAEWGEDPDAPKLSDDERLLVDFGTAIARAPHEIPAALYARLSARYGEEQKVLLVGFAGIMVATNVFNTVVRVPPDAVLEPYLTGAIREFEHVG
jgi:hypothetical protein